MKHSLPFDATLGNIETSTLKHLVVDRYCHQQYQHGQGLLNMDRTRVELATQSLFLFGRSFVLHSLALFYPRGAQQPRCILSYRNKQSVANHIDKPLTPIS
uniref:Uncharacterized protein orf100g n=2 Tax=Beta TaxID=3554 RepID=E6ZDX3_BETVM|nr:hypothetical protein LKY74_mgp130 [Beta vulgaris subsp. maritima]YP_004842080.1 hypothetical protein LKY79_mgp128 [Beta macrocarpa]CBJ23363.1 hypothetical protein [Beta vulgaris subsp. maritima]CBL52049.1 hypothetical protein [Beta vulgaris subsp. maritima]CBX24882.1 hypothetical protein [Beta macrocarpa]CBX33239.1 hypothetical protein [Beta vulgaris subsp. maritima]CBX33291.1 hypothetical protein [Beta vulgaris subsp. maritima]